MNINGYAGIFIKTNNFCNIIEKLKKYLPTGHAYLVPPLNGWISIYEEKFSQSYNLDDADFICGICDELKETCFVSSFHPEFGFSFRLYNGGEMDCEYNSLMSKKEDLNFDLLKNLIEEEVFNTEDFSTVLFSNKYDDEGKCSRVSDLIGIENFFISYFTIEDDKNTLFKGWDLFKYYNGVLLKDGIAYNDKLDNIENVYSSNREIYVWSEEMQKIDILKFKEVLLDFYKNERIIIRQIDGLLSVEFDEKNFVEIDFERGVPEDARRIFVNLSPTRQISKRLRNVRSRYSLYVNIGASRDVLFLQRTCAYIIARLTHGVIDNLDSFYEPMEFILRYEDISEKDFLFDINDEMWIDIVEVEKLDAIFREEDIEIVNHYFKEQFPDSSIKKEKKTIIYSSGRNYIILKKVEKYYRIDKLYLTGDKGSYFYVFLIRSLFKAFKVLFIYSAMISDDFVVYKRVLTSSKKKFAENRKKFANILYLPKIKSIFDNLASSNPNNSFYRFMLGELTFAEDAQKAYSYYKEALLLDPSRYSIYFALGDCCRAMKQFDEARDYFLLALSFKDMPDEKRVYIEDFLKQFDKSK